MAVQMRKKSFILQILLPDSLPVADPAAEWFL